MGSVVRLLACFVFSAVAALSAAATLFAQNPARLPAETAQAPRRYVAIGCLSREASSAAGKPAFVLTDNRGDKPTIYRVEGDEKQLDLHVGHYLELSGALSRTKTASGELLVLKVEQLIWVASTCSKTA